MADDGDSGARGGGGLLLLEKRERNMAEGPNTTATPSNQLVVKCSLCSNLLYKCIWSLCIGEPFEAFCEEDNEHDQYAMAVHLNNV